MYSFVKANITNYVVLLCEETGAPSKSEVTSTLVLDKSALHKQLVHLIQKTSF